MLYHRKNGHGGERYGRQVALDFSVNTNPLGVPPSVRAAVQEAAWRLDEYPDPSCRAITGALAERENVLPEWILWGNGAAELIYAYCAALRPVRALEAVPTFSEYAAALLPCGGQIEPYFLRRENDFALTSDFLTVLERTECKVVFLCNPNNPTGRLIDPALLSDIATICHRREMRLFVDECFLDFTEGVSLKHLLAAFPGLFLLRAFTKSYALSGLRLGYCFTSDTALLEKMAQQCQPWNVSLPAQVAGLAAIQSEGVLEQTRHLIEAQRPQLQSALEAQRLYVCPSAANFLLFQAPADLGSGLLHRGILIRDCSNYAGLSPGWFRVAVRQAEENQQLITAVHDFLVTKYVLNR